MAALGVEPPEKLALASRRALGRVAAHTTGPWPLSRRIRECLCISQEIVGGSIRVGLNRARLEPNSHASVELVCRGVMESRFRLNP
jgi:hypothetical protein